MHGKIIGVPGILVSFRKLCLVDDGGNDLARILAGMLTNLGAGILGRLDDFQDCRIGG